MRPLAEQDIRNSFINCSKGEARRLPLPAISTNAPGTTSTSWAGGIRERPIAATWWPSGTGARWA